MLKLAFRKNNRQCHVPDGNDITSTFAFMTSIMRSKSIRWRRQGVLTRTKAKESVDNFGEPISPKFGWNSECRANHTKRRRQLRHKLHLHLPLRLLACVAVPIGVHAWQHKVRILHGHHETHRLSIATPIQTHFRAQNLTNGAMKEEMQVVLRNMRPTKSDRSARVLEIRV